METDADGYITEGPDTSDSATWPGVVLGPPPPPPPIPPWYEGTAHDFYNEPAITCTDTPDNDTQADILRRIEGKLGELVVATESLRQTIATKDWAGPTLWGKPVIENPDLPIPDIKLGEYPPPHVPYC